VDGNDLVVKLPEGTKEMTVPEDFRFNVDGQLLSVHDLKPGIVGPPRPFHDETTMVPVSVTEVKNGTVMKRLGGTSIIVRTDENIQLKMFSQADVDKRGVRSCVTACRRRSQTSARATSCRRPSSTTMPPKVLTEKGGGRDPCQDRAQDGGPAGGGGDAHAVPGRRRPSASAENAA
jgi:hypothetical protein